MNSFLPNNPYRFQAYTHILIATVIWGIAGPIIKYTLTGLDPLVFLVYRFAISAVLGVLIMFALRLRLPTNRNLLALTLFVGFLNTTFALGLLFLGFDKTSAVNGVLIGATAPIFVVIAGVLFLKEHVTIRERIGITIAFAGTIVTLFEPILKFNNSLGGLEGNLLVLASVLSGAAVAILSKKILREEVNPITLTNLGFIIGFFTLTPLVLLFYPPTEIIRQITTTSLNYHLSVWFMAVFSGTIAYIFWHKAQKTIEVGEVAVFTYLTPLISLPLAVLWLKETISLPFMAGAAIIALGVAVAEYKKNSKHQARNSKQYLNSNNQKQKQF